MSLASTLSGSSTIGKTALAVGSATVLVGGAAVATVIATFPSPDKISVEDYFQTKYEPQHYIPNELETLQLDQHFSGIDKALLEVYNLIRLPEASDLNNYTPESALLRDHLSAIDSMLASGSTTIDLTLPSSDELFYTPTDDTDIASHLIAISETVETQNESIIEVQTLLGTFPAVTYGSSTTYDNDSSAAIHFQAIDTALTSLATSISGNGLVGTLRPPTYYTETGSDVGGHLEGVDNALGVIQSTLATQQSTIAITQTTVTNLSTIVGSIPTTTSMTYGGPFTSVASHLSGMDTYMGTLQSVVSGLETAVGVIPLAPAPDYAQPSSLTVSDYLSDLNSYIGNLSFSPNNYSNPSVDTVANHLQAIDTKLGSIVNIGTLAVADYQTGIPTTPSDTVDVHLSKVDTGLDGINAKIGTLPAAPSYFSGFGSGTTIGAHLSAISNRVAPVLGSAQTNMPYIKGVSVDIYGRVIAVTPVTTTTTSTYGRTGDMQFDSFTVDEFIGTPHLSLQGGTFNPDVGLDMGTKPALLPVVDKDAFSGTPLPGMIVFHPTDQSIWVYVGGLTPQWKQVATTI